MEGLVANIALVGLLAGMRELVVLVVALLVEALAAKLTRVRLETIVNPHVSVKGGAAIKGLATCSAFVRLIVCVDDLVAAQCRCLSEPLPAHLADKGPSTWGRKCQSQFPSKVPGRISRNLISPKGYSLV